MQSKTNPFRMFRTTIITFLFSIPFAAQAQLVITGKVIAGETGLPLQGASVFADNTTLGTATDADGNFKLYLPNGGYYLVVTFTGYSTASKRISSNDASEKQNFELKLKEKELTEVAVVASSEVKDGWQKYGSFFLEAFIGKSENSSNCTLINPEVLKFYFSKKRNRLKVLAVEPLKIENKALGYSIQYSLDSFTHQYNTETSLYTGNPLFKEMMAESDSQYNQWKETRKKAYLGSSLHFMRSIFYKTLQVEGFEIQFIVKANSNDSALKLVNPYTALHYAKDDSLNTVEIYPNQPNVAVIFTKEKPSEKYSAAFPGEPREFEFSVLCFVPNETIVIEQNGYYYDQNDLSVSAYWSWSKVADQLPYDYSAAAY